MHAYSWVTIAIAFRVISGRSLGMMTVSNRRYLQTSPYGVNGSLGLFAILRGLFRFEYDPNITVVLDEAVNFWSLLLVRVTRG